MVAAAEHRDRLKHFSRIFKCQLTEHFRAIGSHFIVKMTERNRKHTHTYTQRSRLSHSYYSVEIIKMNERNENNLLMVYNGGALDIAYPYPSDELDVLFRFSFLFASLENGKWHFSSIFHWHCRWSADCILKQWHILCVNESNRERHPQRNCVIKCKISCVTCNPNLVPTHLI